MLYFSLLFVLAGMTVFSVACLMIAYLFITTGEKIPLLTPKKWPVYFIKWTYFGAAGLTSVIIGMIITVFAV